MWKNNASRFLVFGAAFLWVSTQAAAEPLKPFILGDTLAGDVRQVSELVKTKLTAQGFEIVGAYSPFPGAMVICVTNNDLMVDGGRVVAMRARYRIALNFPDTKMAGEHGFTKIMTAPWGIQVALEAVAGFKREM